MTLGFLRQTFYFQEGLIRLAELQPELGALDPDGILHPDLTLAGPGIVRLMRSTAEESEPGFAGPRGRPHSLHRHDEFQGCANRGSRQALLAHSACGLLHDLIGRCQNLHRPYEVFFFIHAPSVAWSLGHPLSKVKIFLQVGFDCRARRIAIGTEYCLWAGCSLDGYVEVVPERRDTGMGWSIVFQARHSISLRLWVPRSASCRGPFGFQ